MTERCGDRQPKLDGLEKWYFRLLVEGLPVMLQAALLLLGCALSRYMWSVNTSVARVVIAFTALVVVFYLVIVVAGASSYECPFQTPASIALRTLRHNKGVRKVLTAVSPPTLIARIHTTGINTRNRATSALRQLGRSLRILIAKTSLSGTIPGIQRGGRNVGHSIILSLHRLDRGFRNAKLKLIRGVLGLRRALLPVYVDALHHQLPPEVKLRLVPPNLDILSERNSKDASCVCWVLRNITDPEAIDSAIRLAATVRWFEGDIGIDLQLVLRFLLALVSWDEGSSLFLCGSCACGVRVRTG